MKVKSTKIEPEFQPTSITITFETQDELYDFYSLFNHSTITRLVPSLDHDKIRESLNNVGCPSVARLTDKL